MDGDDFVCERDGAPTRLRCAGCETAICTACLVRTPVGHKCPGCAGAGGAGGRGGRRRTGPLLLAAGVGVLVLLGAVTLLRPQADDPAPVPDPLVAEAAAPEAPPTRQAMIGEEAGDGQLRFLVDGVACLDREGSATAKLCTLRFTVRNASTAPAVLLGRFQYLVDAQARTYGADEALTRAVPENANRGLSDVTVNPGVAVPLAFVFELPAAVEPEEARFRGTGRSGFGVSVRLQRRP